MIIKLDFTALEKDLKKIERQSVIVGVLNKSVKAASIDYSKPVTSMSTLSGSTKRRYIKTKGRNKNITLRKLALILDKKRGIFSEFMLNASNKDLIAVAQSLAIFNKTPSDIKRLENAGRALVRNPILRKDYNPNKKSTRDAKGFNHYAFATSTLFKNITARYEKW